jgi:signal transduction histidine kinase
MAPRLYIARASISMIYFNAHRTDARRNNNQRSRIVPGKIFNRAAISYGITGFALGLLFPLCATMMSGSEAGGVTDALLLHLRLPLLWLADLVPFITGIGALYIGGLRAAIDTVALKSQAQEAAHRVIDQKHLEILNSIPIALFTINPDRSINTRHSELLEKFVGPLADETRRFPEIIGVTDERVAQFERWIGLIFGAFDVPWDSVSELTPISEITIGTAAEESRHLSVSYAPLHTHGSTTTLMVMLQDISAYKNLESKIGRQEQRHEDELSEIAEIIKLDYATFENFIFESKKIISESTKVIESLDFNTFSSDKTNDLFRKMHTLKGNSRAFNFIQLGQLAHQVEDSFALLRDRKMDVTESLLNRIKSQIFEIEQKLDSIIELAKSVMSGKDLGKVRSDNRDVFIRVKLEKVLNLIRIVDRLHKGQGQLSESQENLFLTLESSISSLRLCPATRLFSRFPKMIKDLAVALGKNITVTILGGEIELDLDTLDKLANAIVHIVRNAVDHGIETPDERSDAGKPFMAQIEIKLSKQEGAYLFTVSDDGRGIDTNNVLKKALEDGLVTTQESANITKGKIYELIMQPGFTTAEKVTDISGRGIGMNVVSEILKTLNGVMTVQSEPGSGTTFLISIPDAKLNNDFFSLDFAQDSAILTVMDAGSTGLVNELRAIIYPVIKGEISRLYMDISKMHLVTSEFIGFLVTLNLLLKEGNKILYIVNTNKDHLEALQLAHINKMVEIIRSI